MCPEHRVVSEHEEGLRIHAQTHGGGGGGVRGTQEPTKELSVAKAG